MHESLEKIKEYASYYDWYDHVSIYDLRFLITQAEKFEWLSKAVQTCNEMDMTPKELSAWLKKNR